LQTYQVLLGTSRVGFEEVESSLTTIRLEAIPGLYRAVNYHISFDLGKMDALPYLTNIWNDNTAISSNSSNESGQSEERLKKHLEFWTNKVSAVVAANIENREGCAVVDLGNIASWMGCTRIFISAALLFELHT